MEQYNFKIVAEFKEPLPQNEIVKLTQIQEKLNIIKINENSYCKSQPIHNYDDLGETALFFNIIDEIPNEYNGIKVTSDIAKEFMKRSIESRYNLILQPALRKIRMKSNDRER